MKQPSSTTLGFLGSVGCVIGVIVSWICFSWIGIVGRVLLYVIGVAVIGLVIPDVVDGIREWKRNRDA